MNAIRILRTFALPGLLLCGTLLTGCHGGKQTNAFEVPSSLDTSSKQEITFWAKNDTNKAQTLIYEKAVEDFEAMYPNISVNIRLYTNYGDIYNDVITNIATNTTPNVCITYPDHIATYMTGENVVVPLDSLMSDQEYGLGGSSLLYDSPKQSEIVSEFLEECKLGDSYYALPYMRSTEACYVNKTYVEELGFELPEVLTWDFIWEVSEAALKKNDDGTYAINNQKVMIPFIYKSTDNMMITMLRQKEAGYSQADGTIEIFNETTKELLTELAGHVKSGAFSTFKISGYPGNFLNAGQCIFAVDSTAGATWMGSKAPLMDIAKEKIAEFELAVLPVPQFDDENPKMISQGPSICLFNKEDPQEVLASWLFMQYLLTNEVQCAYSETEGYVPVTTKAQNSEEYLAYLEAEGSDGKAHYAPKIQAAKMLMEYTENTFTTAVFNGSASLRDAAGELVENLTKSVRRKAVVSDDFFKEQFANITALYRLDQIRVSEGGSGARKELGPLPAGAKALLYSLAGIWLIMIGSIIIRKVKNTRSAA